MARATSAWAPERADVIWIQHTPAAGREIPELHPMLVASTRAFNERTGILIGFPMTHAEFHADNPFAIEIQGPKGKAFVLAHQPKSFDWRARGAKKHPWGGGHQQQLEESLEVLAQICGLPIPG
nr:type II toxin-antitoxin system PemK/MazF family toxin [Ramlibacter albus]